jgi:uncharacterized protein YegP (UPF0339 family)
MAHKFVIRKSDANGEYRAYFEYNGEKIFWTKGLLEQIQCPECDRFRQEQWG